MSIHKPAPTLKASDFQKPGASKPLSKEADKNEIINSMLNKDKYFEDGYKPYKELERIKEVLNEYAKDKNWQRLSAVTFNHNPSTPLAKAVIASEVLPNEINKEEFFKLIGPTVTEYNYFVLNDVWTFLEQNNIKLIKI